MYSVRKKRNNNTKKEKNMQTIEMNRKKHTIKYADTINVSVLKKHRMESPPIRYIV